jgi:hypothetical protein
LTIAQARQWAGDFNSWEIVDTASDLFVEARLLSLIPEMAPDEREFVRRTAFAMIACAAVHMKTEPDGTFLAWLPPIESPQQTRATSYARRPTGHSATSESAIAIATKPHCNWPRGWFQATTRQHGGLARMPSGN